jgi:hypothetical protein
MRDTSPDSEDAVIPPLKLDLSVTEFMVPMRALHRGKDGVVGFTSKRSDGGWNTLFSYTIAEIEEMFPALAQWLVQDAYFTVNSMYSAAPFKSRTTQRPGVLRKEKHLRYLNACYVDLDVGRPHSRNPNARKSPNETMMEIMDMMEDGLIPQCSLFARSGQGCYVFWLLRDDNDPNSPPRYWPEKLTLYKKINKAISKRLKKLAPDENASDAARVLRAPGTRHSTTGVRAAYTVHYDAEGKRFTYTLSELARAFGVKEMEVSLPEQTRDVALPSSDLYEIPGHVEVKKETTRCPARAAGPKVLNAKRAQDLVCVEQARGGWKKGHRRAYLKIYAHFLHGVPSKSEDVLRAVKIMAANCNPPYPSDANDTDVEKIVAEVFSGSARKFSNANLVKWLNIPVHEAEALDLKTLLPPEITEKRKMPPGGQRAVEKAARHDFLTRYIEQSGPPSARDLVKVLALQGIYTSHTTINSDLNELGYCTPSARKKAGRPSITQLELKP